MTCICLFVVNVINVVQYIIAHDIILTKCLKLNFENVTCQNFSNFSEHSSINIVFVSESLCNDFFSLSYGHFCSVV